jgi:hypothetical protein
MSTSAYTPEIGASICAQLCEGQSLRSICEAEGAPDKSTVMAWLHRHEDFRRMYIAARELGAEAMADEVIAIATAKMAPEDVPAVRIRLDAVKWAAAKFAPKRWGDQAKVELSGAVQLQPVAPPLNPPEITARFKAALARGEQAAGLPPNHDADDDTRVRAIVATGKLTPEIYAATHADPPDSDDAP